MRARLQAFRCSFYLYRRHCEQQTVTKHRPAGRVAATAIAAAGVLVAALTVSVVAQPGADSAIAQSEPHSARIAQSASPSVISRSAAGASASAADLTGPAGPSGPPGPVGPGPRAQSIAIDWQNGAYAGHDTASFTVPGIGEGEVKCSPDTQWLRLRPLDAGADTEMWATIMRRDQITVRAAARRDTYYGPDVNLGLNEVNGTEATAQGQMMGIISSRGQFALGSPDAVPAPATFRLAWHWSFGDAYGPRCYVNGVVVTAGG
jgi:hypothetical protein